MRRDMMNIYPTTPFENNSPSLLNSLFEEASCRMCPVETELRVYFDMHKMPKYDLSDPLYKKHNPLVFWHDNQLTLPLMAQQARRSLAIPGTSVSSERLFSDAGNVVTEKRNRLHPNTVHDLLFLKENQHCFNPYSNLN
ncbi:9748_t:CDS:1 [Ambispora gerdemannii]|uniref:9748_t:CDS:1 n=1 Tax=Ambispora gerdemannii TaxID=144530 RepID=A0A9N9FSH7_9GLOM|nr:9748_t:CDS:1 [Ambispora gerdemannii]